MAIQGVTTQLSAMKTAANQATDCAQRLQAAVQRLNGDVHGSLDSWETDAKAAFWNGHEGHVASVAKLVRSLNTMSEGINTSSTRYDATDQDSQAEQVRVAGAGSGIPMNLLGA